VVDTTGTETTPVDLHTVEQHARVTGWRAVGAAAPGASHIDQGMPCQDALRYLSLKVDGQSVLVAALSDGAGSAEQSEQGAQAATDAAVEALKIRMEAGLPVDESAWRELLVDSCRAAQSAVLGLAEQTALPPRSFASTLACLVAADGCLAAATLGDGVIVAQRSSGELITITRPQRGEYANETVFLVQDDALDQVQVEILPEAFSALAMFSDGLLRLALNFPEHAPFGPFFRPLFGFAAQAEPGAEADAQLEAFLRSERVNARTDDDKTLLLAVRDGGKDL
jgi:hypothetical protein